MIYDAENVCIVADSTELKDVDADNASSTVDPRPMSTYF